MGFFARLFGSGDKKSTGTEASRAGSDAADVIRGLREMVLSLSGTDLPLSRAQNQPLAVLMEFCSSGTAVSLVAVADGSVSLYFSHGGGVIGAGEHEPVRRVAASFLELAAELSDRMGLAQSTPLPSEGTVRFYVVLQDGVRNAEVSEDVLKAKRHPLWSLYYHGHAVIGAIREHSPV